MKIALDLESVLAEPNEAVYNSTEKLGTRDKSTWFGDGKDSVEYQIYMGVSDAIWRHKPELIVPEEPNLAEYVAKMREDHEVHIVTARLHVDEQAEWWLAEHGIEYDKFISTDKPKYEFTEYDVFIDDNPNMVGKCRLFLRHQPWNADAPDEESKLTTRIHSLAEVLPYL